MSLIKADKSLTLLSQKSEFYWLNTNLFNLNVSLLILLQDVSDVHSSVHPLYMTTHIFIFTSRYFHLPPLKSKATLRTIIGHVVADQKYVIELSLVLLIVENFMHLFDSMQTYFFTYCKVHESSSLIIL